MVQGTITNNGIAQEIIKYFYSPNLSINDGHQNFENLYYFISRIEPWDNENSPPTPVLTDKFIKDIHKNIISIKKINSNDMSPVIERIDWTANTIYSQYSDSQNMLEIDASNKLLKQFYVRNSYDQVFKCLDNKTNVDNPNGSKSTIQPVVDFSYDTFSGYIETGDGYKWKFLFSIDPGSKFKFFDDKWIPIPLQTHRKNIYTDSSVGSGEITNINVYNSGSGYTNDAGVGISTTITIDGDGTGANAVAIITGNSVFKVLMANTGSNYTYATASISPNPSFSGNGAQLIATISPIGGHGYNLLQELGCRTLMVTATLDSSENGVLPSDIDYRQVGLLVNPTVKLNSSYQFANGYIYKYTHDVFVSPGRDPFIQDETVYQGNSIQTSTYSGKVLNFDAINNILYLINTEGTITTDDLIRGSSSNALRVVYQEVVETIEPFSGNIVYVENRNKIQRTVSGLEQFRLTINY